MYHINGCDWASRVGRALLGAIALLVLPASLLAETPGVSIEPEPNNGVAFRSGAWSIFRLAAINRSAEPQRVLAATGLSGEQSLEHARQLYLPPRSKRVVEHPLFLPAGLPAAQRQLEVKTVGSIRPIDNGQQIEHSSGNAGGRTSTLPLEGGLAVTGLIADSDDVESRRFVAALRRAQSLPESMTHLQPGGLPALPEALSPYDQLVLASPAIADDPAGVQTLRRWIEQGGAIWIMLDRVPADAVAGLFGDLLVPAVVDRTSLARLQLVDLRDTPRKVDGPAVSLSSPVEMVRAIPGKDAKIAFGVDGWPAAFWQSVGRGRVLFTTIGLSAWDGGTATFVGPVAKDPVKRVPGGTPLEALANEFFKARKRVNGLPPAAEEYAASSIGYSTMDRAEVLVVLGSCTIGLSSIVWLSIRRRHPFLLVWAAPVLALLTSAALLTMGARSRSALAPTLTSVQFIEAAPQSGDLHVSSVIGAYHPKSTSAGVTGHRALLSPETAPLAGSAGRVVWTDRDQWHLENVSLPAGVTIGQATWVAESHDRSFITATLTKNGIEGQLVSPLFQDCRDAIMVAPGAPDLAVTIDEKGAFSAGPDATLEPGQFVGSQLLDDREKRRQALYREFLAGGRRNLAIERPSLMFWTTALKSPVALGQAEREVGEALVLAPMTLSHPPAGSTIAIPSLLIPWKTATGPDGTPVTSAYSNAERRWVEGLTTATNITLRFQMPTSALPLTIQRATLFLEITAPSRDVSVVAWNGVQPLLLTKASSPMDSRMIVTVDDPHATGLDARGGLLLNINVGRHPREQEANLAQSGWHIDRAWLDVNESTTQAR